MAASENPMPYFPDDVWMDIFLRLSVRSLLLIKPVSKHWHSLIQSPTFINMHLNCNNESVTNPILIVRRDRSSKKFFLTVVSEGDSDDDSNDDFDDNSNNESIDDSDDEEKPFFLKDVYIEDVPLDLAIRGESLHEGKLRLLGPCNGLFCITNTVNVVVFNPATKRCRKVYRSPLSCKSSSWYEGNNVGCFDSVGFGYDAVEKDYKVVRFDLKECADDDHDVDGDDDDFGNKDEHGSEEDDDHDASSEDYIYDFVDEYEYKSDEPKHESDDDDGYDVVTEYDGCSHGLHFKVEIYSLCTNTWRELRCGVPTRDRSTVHSYSLFFNGGFHWLHAVSILVFDLNKEAFGWFELPNSYIAWLKTFDVSMEEYEDGDLCTYLSVLNASLALTVQRKSNHSFDGFEIWVMMEYGVCGSWRKLYNISRDKRIERPLSFSNEECLAEVKILKKVKSMSSTNTLKYHGHLMSFNLKTKNIKRYNVFGVPGSVQAFRYRESMVSLK